MSGGKP